GETAPAVVSLDRLAAVPHDRPADDRHHRVRRRRQPRRLSGRDLSGPRGPEPRLRHAGDAVLAPAAPLPRLPQPATYGRHAPAGHQQHLVGAAPLPREPRAPPWLCTPPCAPRTGEPPTRPWRFHRKPGAEGVGVRWASASPAKHC